MRGCTRRLVVVLAWGIVGPPALAQGDAADPGPRRDPARLRLSAEPSLWYVAPGGTVTMPRSGPGASDSFELFDVAMDAPRASPYVEINIRNDEWGLTFRGFQYSAEDRAWVAAGAFNLGDVAIAPGDLVRSTLDFGSFELEGAYRLQRPKVLARRSSGTPRMEVELDAIAGVRVYDFDLAFERVAPTPGAARASETFFEVLAGLKGALEIHEQLTVDLHLSVGGMVGDRQVLSIDISPGFTWRPHPNLGVQIGYRQLFFDLSRQGPEPFEWTGATAGLFFGLVLRF